MSWRIVIISHRCKLDFSMNYMVIRGEETRRILLDEVAIVMLENNAISMTGCLLSALVEKKIKVILCDVKRNPQAELVPLYGCHNDSLKIKEQISWDTECKRKVWTSIVKEKIRNQSKLLERMGKEKESEKLRGYIEEVVQGDLTNREGHAAKVYFNALFGMSFVRNDGENPINSALDYGYGLILSAFNREITANGYITQIGLGHDNQFNHFNLSCDLMEPFRIVVDEKIKSMSVSNFGTEEKHEMVGLLNAYYEIRGTNQTLLNAIKLYTKSVFDAIDNNSPDLINYIDI